MAERMRFVADYLEDVYWLTELAERYGISRKTAYKWLRRYAESGAAGLEARRSVASQVWNRTDREVEEALIVLRKKQPRWGARKLLEILGGQRPEVAWPAASTVAAILKRNGLVEGRRRRRREGHPGRPKGEPEAPNQVWAMDFKGQFRTRDRRYCYPFTVSDLASRYLLCCDGYLSTQAEGVKASLIRVFREHGLPEAIRSDNGSPFASTGIGRLTRLGVWLVSLGIKRQLIEPASPSQNGKHERMHRTLGEETTRPPAANLRRQQDLFDSFRRMYNEERPHQALGMKRPAQLYCPSPRPYPEAIPPIEYPGHFEVRWVSRNGAVRWHNQWLCVGHALIEQHLGFEEVDDGIWDVYFSTLPIGRFDERKLQLVGTLGTHYRCGKRGDRHSRPRKPEPPEGDLPPSHSTATTTKNGC